MISKLPSTIIVYLSRLHCCDIRPGAQHAGSTSVTPALRFVNIWLCHRYWSTSYVQCRVTVGITESNSQINTKSQQTTLSTWLSVSIFTAFAKCICWFSFYHFYCFHINECIVLANAFEITQRHGNRKLSVSQVKWLKCHRVHEHAGGYWEVVISSQLCSGFFVLFTSYLVLQIALGPPHQREDDVAITSGLLGVWPIRKKVGFRGGLFRRPELRLPDPVRRSTEGAAEQAVWDKWGPFFWTVTHAKLLSWSPRIKVQSWKSA